MNDKDTNKILKFNDFNHNSDSTSEAMYKADENGDIVKQDYEFYSDHYPEKFKYATSSEETEALYKDCNNVWILKHDDKIIATFSGELEEEVIRESIEILKNVNEKEIENDEESGGIIK
tara:strand:+ start:370 stop:726 length:357 start_codon:yes stop_codon:yes gene_type:complete